MRILALVFCVAVATSSGTARADEIQFTNGDRLTGKVVALKDGSLAFDSKLAGTLALKWNDIATLSTDDPVTLQLEGGSVIVDKLVASDPGTVKTAGSAQVTAQTVELANTVKVNPEPVQWKGTLTAGADIERGNTTKTGAAIDLAAVRRSETDRITFTAGYAGEESAEKGSDHQTPTKSKEYGSLQYDYFLGKQLYVYGNAKGEKDRIADLALRFTAGAGVGYQWFETEALKWNTEAGLSWVSENYTNDTSNNDYIALRLASNLEYLLYPGLTFFQKTQLYPSLEDSNLFVDTATGFRYKLFGSFFGESKMLWSWNSNPAAGNEKTDLAFILGVGYGF